MKFASIALGMSVLMAPSSGLLRASIRKREIRMAQDAQMQPTQKQKLKFEAEMSHEAHTAALLREQLQSELLAAGDGSVVRLDDATVVRAEAVQSEELREKDGSVAQPHRHHPHRTDSATEAADEARADAQEARADELLHAQLQRSLTEASTAEASQREDALSPQEEQQKRLTEEQTRLLFEEAVPINPGREQRPRDDTMVASQAPGKEHTHSWSGLSKATHVSKQVQKHTQRARRSFSSTS